VEKQGRLSPTNTSRGDRNGQEGHNRYARGSARCPKGLRVWRQENRLAQERRRRGSHKARWGTPHTGYHDRTHRHPEASAEDKAAACSGVRGTPQDGRKPDREDSLCPHGSSFLHRSTPFRHMFVFVEKILACLVLFPPYVWCPPDGAQRPSGARRLPGNTRFYSEKRYARLSSRRGAKTLASHHQLSPVERISSCDIRGTTRLQLLVVRQVAASSTGAMGIFSSITSPSTRDQPWYTQIAPYEDTRPLIALVLPRVPLGSKMALAASRCGVVIPKVVTPAQCLHLAPQTSPRARSGRTS